MISVKEIACVALPRSRADGALLMLTAYFDDTGTHKDSPLIGFGGLIANEGIWRLFEASWYEKLQSPLPGKPALSRFHMYDCVHHINEFAGYSEPESDALIHDFRQIIIASGVWGYSVGASVNDWKEIIRPPILYWLGDAEAFCFRDCIAKMQTFARLLSPVDKQLALVFDNRPERHEINGKIIGQFNALPQLDDVSLLGVTFQKSEKFLPLQGADMFAWEFFRHVGELVLTDIEPSPRPHARQFFETGRFHMGVVDRLTCEKLSAAGKALGGSV